MAALYGAESSMRVAIAGTNIQTAAAEAESHNSDFYPATTSAIESRRAPQALANRGQKLRNFIPPSLQRSLHLRFSLLVEVFVHKDPTMGYR